MKKTKRRSLVMSVLMMVLSLALVASGTYALFSDQVKMTHHLQAGELDITLVRTNLTTKALDPVTGYMKSSSKDDVPEKDFSNPNGENVFGITDKTLIVPLSSYAATMKITNNSDVAFGYWLEIVFDDTVDLTLAEQLKITVTTVDESKSISKMLNTSAGLIGAEADPVGVLAKGGSALFTVTVEFCDLDHSVNNNAKGTNFDFDIIVHAVQVTDAPSV